MEPAAFYDALYREKDYRGECDYLLAAIGRLRGERGATEDALRILDLRAGMRCVESHFSIMGGIHSKGRSRLVNGKVRKLTYVVSNTKMLDAAAKGDFTVEEKEDSDSELLTAIDRVMHEDLYISPHLMEEFSDDLIRSYREKGIFPCETLTNREIEVLKLVAEGLTSKEIAELLSISIRTVEHHRANLLKKLNLKNTADLIKHAIQNGFIHEAD